MRKVIFGFGLLAGLAIAVDNLYRHPTYGNGLRAALAAIQAGEFFV